MNTKRRVKAILASLLVTMALTVPTAVLSGRADTVEAELYFSGVTLDMLPDGSIQAIFEVSVDKALNCNGASFILDYNPEYFTPSYIDGTVKPRNTPFTTTTSADDDGFFAYDRDLYKPEINPFREEVSYGPVFDEETGTVVTKTSKYSTVTVSDHRISMDLWFDRDKLTETTAVGKLVPLKDVGFDGKTALVLNKYDPYDKNATDNVTTPERVALGRLSFWVDPDRLDEIARYFPQPFVTTETAEVRMDNGQDTYLIRTAKPEAGEESYRDSWQIGVYQSDYASDDWHEVYYRENPHGQDDAAGLSKRYYELAVNPKQIMRVRPAEEEVTINAYQAFTDKNWNDVAQALRRYSPMATITYVDGTQENVVIPWGKEGDEYSYTVEVQQGDTFVTADWTTDPEHPNPVYNPLEGVYKVTQYVPGKSIHPLPITVKLTVTPIHLIDVEVENQTLTYDLDQVVGLVAGPGDLKLPEKARLITDVVPGGVSMVMDIPGWSPNKGTWPVPSATNENTLMNSIKEDSFGTADAPTGEEGFDAATMPYWPDDADNGAIGADQYYQFLKQKKGNWIGEYTFHMIDKVTGTQKDGFTKPEIQHEFPWLTVTEDKYDVPNALRQIVTERSYTNALSYTASYVRTTVTANGQPELTLSVQRENGSAMEVDSIFRVWLPNGQELGTGLNTTVWPDTETKVDNWFPEDETTHAKNGDYQSKFQGDGGNRYFHLTTNPGDPETGVYPDERRTLQRYINLGGWYYVAVCEDPTSRTWSDPMPVFVPARPNEYQEDKEYNFVGENTELFHWTGGLTHYVTMPRGTYTAVNEKGERLYDAGGQIVTLAEMLADKATYGDYLDDKDRPKTTTLRYELPYGYTTTYDGSTGAQPGTLHSFQVGPTTADPGDTWNHVVETFKTAASALPPGADIWRYGADPFYDGAVYPAFGKVTQPTGVTAYNTTIRRDQVAEKTGNTRITLTSEEPIGITRVDPSDMDSNVTLATYDTRTTGYTDRQEYKFKITNVGTEPVYGLAIDGLTDGYPDDPTGGRFEMLQPPADFLAPGQSTTFVLTYVYNLAANKAPDTPIYRDTLYVTSSDHPNGKKDGTNQDKPAADGSYDYLLDFDAQFEVSDRKIHTVTVVVNPGDLSMGSAGLIVGRQGNTMNYTVTTRAYPKENKVYVAVYMKDEYTLQTVPPIGVDAAGNPVALAEITKENSGITLQPNIRIFEFTMPDYDTTVVVNFEEKTQSKLRLSDLIDFSAGTQAELKQNRNSNDPVTKENTYEVWRKSFNDKEIEAADNWHSTHTQNPEADLYLMTAGTTISRDKGGRQFIDTENQYIVVIPYDADWSQVEVKLRQLETHNDYQGNGMNVDITPNVVMHHYGKDIRDTWNTTVDVEDEVYQGMGYTAAAPTATPPDYTPSVHTSDIFKSPDPGTSNYVRITASYGNEKRSYYLEIHRAPEKPEATLNYGNSPCGMIMNDDQFKRGTEDDTKEAKRLAKEAFENNNYTFNGLTRSNIPYLIWKESAVSQEAVYWPEAWVHNTQLFETESLTGFNITYKAPDLTLEPNADPDRRDPTATPDPAVYIREENLDLDDYAFFAILGENMKEPGLAAAWDSTGRLVDLATVHAQVTVTLLDTEAATQIGRFSGDQTATLDMGVAGQLLNGLPEPGVMNAAKAGTWPVSSETDEDTGVTTYTQVEHIRPGQYTLEYVYSDYNGDPLIVSRPLVILPAVGDVNSDGIVDSTSKKNTDKSEDETDEATLKNRVADPLGYVAGKWELISGAWEETVYPRANIFKYRVVDVNNDRNVNNIDGNLIDKIVRGSAEAIRFYNPVNYVHKDP